MRQNSRSCCFHERQLASEPSDPFAISASSNLRWAERCGRSMQTAVGKCCASGRPEHPEISSKRRPWSSEAFQRWSRSPPFPNAIVLAAICSRSFSIARSSSHRYAAGIPYVRGIASCRSAKHGSSNSNVRMTKDRVCATLDAWNQGLQRRGVRLTFVRRCAKSREVSALRIGWECWRSIEPPCWPLLRDRTTRMARSAFSGGARIRQLPQPL